MSAEPTLQKLSFPDVMQMSKGSAEQRFAARSGQGCAVRERRQFDLPLLCAGRGNCAPCRQRQRRRAEPRPLQERGKRRDEFGVGWLDDRVSGRRAEKASSN